VASKKKLRKAYFDGKVQLSDLSEEDAKYILKYMNKTRQKLMEMEDYSVTTFKEVPCQKLPGKKVLVPIDSKIVEGEDGLLYLGDVQPENLIVSAAYKERESYKAHSEYLKNKEQREKDVINLNPTVLGEDGT